MDKNNIRMNGEREKATHLVDGKKTTGRHDSFRRRRWPRTGQKVRSLVTKKRTTNGKALYSLTFWSALLTQKCLLVVSTSRGPCPIRRWAFCCTRRFPRSFWPQKISQGFVVFSVVVRYYTKDFMLPFTEGTMERKKQVLERNTRTTTGTKEIEKGAPLRRRRSTCMTRRLVERSARYVRTAS
jgi:hypothetical protein